VSARLRDLVLAACAALEAHRDELGALDSVAGDGDHGVSMSLGARAVRAALEGHPDASGPALLTLIAPAAASVGGAIGPLWATMLLRSAAAARETGARHGEPSVAHVRACAEAALAGVQALGGARPGDKTVVDALAPAVEALATAEREGRELAAAVRAAADAADAGALATAGLVATLGRASRLGERGRGSMDPGARSLAIAIEAAVSAWLGAERGTRA
jgi:phosphoenolpyruvate---glycerone phosphotransferase subunit DhaL